MKKKGLLYLCGLVFIFGCNNQPTQETKTQETSKKFLLTGKLETHLSNKVYLNKIIDHTLYRLDSATITNNTFTFTGMVEYPERFALTFENYASKVVVILENTNFLVLLNPDHISDPTITGSPLNTKLSEFKETSKNIFKQIDDLYPQFQKARLENDAKKLEEIGEKMRVIENEFINYSYQFIEKNSTSYVAAMVLRDRLKAQKIDTLRIKKTYALLSEKVKQCPDSQIIAATLGLP